jgi:hypothetical protein
MFTKTSVRVACREAKVSVIVPSPGISAKFSIINYSFQAGPFWGRRGEAPRASFVGRYPVDRPHEKRFSCG